MNWVTRFFIASLLTLAGTVGYGALHYAGPIYRNLAAGQPNALFTGVNAFDLQVGGLASTNQSSSFGSGEYRTSPNRQPSFAAATPMVTATPAPYYDDDQNEQDNQNGDEQDDSNEIRGTVSAVNGNMVTINGQTYTLAPGQSEVNGYFQVGSNVKVEYYMNPDGTLTIKELKVVNSSQDKGSSNNSSNYQYNPNNNAPNNYYWCHDDDCDDGGDD